MYWSVHVRACWRTATQRSRSGFADSVFCGVTGVGVASALAQAASVEKSRSDENLRKCNMTRSTQQLLERDKNYVRWPFVQLVLQRVPEARAIPRVVEPDVFITIDQREPDCIDLARRVEGWIGRTNPATARTIDECTHRHVVRPR